MKDFPENMPASRLTYMRGIWSVQDGNVYVATGPRAQAHWIGNIRRSPGELILDQVHRFHPRPLAILRQSSAR